MKIAIIGAGSSYTPELIEGLINNLHHLNLKEIWLNDIEESDYKLDTIYNLSKRMFNVIDKSIVIKKTFDKEMAITNASFIIIQLRIGLLDARIIDEKTVIEHGLLAQETNGIVGMFKFFRTIPIIFSIVELVGKCAKKNAWIINFSNPAGMVAEAVHRYLKFKRFVSICNVPIHIEKMLSNFYDVKDEEIKIDWIGLNHLVFGTKVKIHNIDKTKEAIEAILDPNNKEKFTMRNIEPIPWEPTFIKTLNLVPCPYFKYFVKRKEMVQHMINDYKNNCLRSEIVKDVEKKLFKLYENINLTYKPKELEMRGGAFYSKVAIDVLVGLAGGPEITHAVNYPNNGNVKNFPKGWVLEISSLISKDSIKQSSDIDEIPLSIHGLIMNVKNYELLAIKSGVNGDYNLGLVAMNLNPFSESDIINKIIYDKLFIIHHKYLKHFKGQ